MAQLWVRERGGRECAYDNQTGASVILTGALSRSHRVNSHGRRSARCRFGGARIVGSIATALSGRRVVVVIVVIVVIICGAVSLEVHSDVFDTQSDRSIRMSKGVSPDNLDTTVHGRIGM